LEELPVSEALSLTLGEERARLLALSGGDDYELCFAVPPARLARLGAELPAERWNYRRIGVLSETRGARVLRAGTVMEFSHSGYQHFA
jgi:thiamine-monophosphate kinase